MHPRPSGLHLTFTLLASSYSSIFSSDSCLPAWYLSDTPEAACLHTDTNYPLSSWRASLTTASPPAPHLPSGNIIQEKKMSAVNPWTCRLTKRQNHHSLQNGILSTKGLVVELIFAKVLFSILTTWLDVPSCGWQAAFPEHSHCRGTSLWALTSRNAVSMHLPLAWEMLLLNGWQHLL